VTDSPFVDNDDMPYVHNPIQQLPWLDTRVQVEVFQHRAGLSNRLAEWCGGSVGFTDRLVVLVPDAEDPNVLNPAGLGDFVVLADGAFRVESPDGFNQRFWPVGRDPGWSHRCFMDWEASS
jgi:hypothetical protein